MIIRKSDVQVEYIDLTHVRTEAIQYVNRTSPVSINQIRSADWGIVQTTDGIFCLTKDGYGQADPISDEHPLRIDLWAEKLVHDDIGNPVVFGSTQPQWHAKLSDQELLNLRNGERENLASFIGDTLPVHQENFNKWNSFLSAKFHWDLDDILGKDSEDKCQKKPDAN